MKNKTDKSLKLFLLLIILFISIGFVAAANSDLNDLNNNDLSLSNGDINYIDDNGGDGLINANSNNENPELMDSDVNDLNNKELQLTTLQENKTCLEDNLKKSNSQLHSLKDGAVIEVEHTDNDLSDIQNAIKNAKAGDTVSLGNYAYNIGDGQINLTKRITLLGDGTNTLINGSGGEKVGCVVSLSGITGAVIKGIKFNNPTANLTYTDYDTLYGWAIRLDSSNNILIDNCSFINYNREINIDGSNSNTVNNCYFTGGSTRVTNGNGKERGTRAISFSSNSKYNNIENCTFEGPVLDAINVDAASSTKIIGNTFINNAYSIFLDHVATENTTISNNSFINCGHFETVFNGSNINFQDLPIIDCAASFSNFEICNNSFEVKSNNIIISTAETSEIGNVNITGNIVRPYDNSEVSNITFAKFPTVESKLDLIGHINISNNNINLGSSSQSIVYGKFGNNIRYYSDGDIIVYAHRKNTYLNITFPDKVYKNSVVVNISLYGDSDEDLKQLNGSKVFLKLNNKSYNLTIINGLTSFSLEDELEVANYTLKASYLGNEFYSPADCEKTLSVLDHTKTIFVEHSGNDTRDLLDAIRNASSGDIIDLGDYNYSNVQTIDLNKDLTINGENAGIELSNSSSALFNLGNEIFNLSIDGIVFKVTGNNQSLVFTNEDSNLELLELTNITVVLSQNASSNGSGGSSSGGSSNGSGGSNSSTTIDYNTISLLHIQSNSDSFSIEKFNLNDNSLLEGMKSILVSASNSSSKIIYINDSSIETIVIRYVNDAAIDFIPSDDSVIISLKTKDGRAISNASILVNDMAMSTDNDGEVSLQVSGNYTINVVYIDENNASVSAKYASVVYELDNNGSGSSSAVKYLNSAVIDFVPSDDSVIISLKTKDGQAISNASISVNDISMVTDDDGQVIVQVSDNYTINVVYIDENNASLRAKYTNVINEKINSVIVKVLNDAVIDFVPSEDSVTISLKDKDGQAISNASILVNDISMISDDDGQVIVQVSDNYTINVVYIDENNASVSARITNSVYIVDDSNSSVLTISNDAVIDFVPSEDSVAISLKTKEGNAISNASILVNNVSMISDDDGQVIVQVSGNYTLKVIYIDENNASASASFMKNSQSIIEEKIIEKNNTVYVNVTKEREPSKIICQDMVTDAVAKVDGRIGKYFEVFLVDENGKPLANKLVQIGFNGAVYNRTTNDSGGVKLQINLGYEGKYTFAIAFLGDDNYTGDFQVALITVNKHSPKLTASAKTFKASAKTKSISATFKSANGNAINSKKISFTVNGKTYSGTTNSKGVATVKVTLNKKGTYTCTAKYAGDGMYKATSTKFNLKIV